jgi:hypothetical protein
LLSAYPPDRLRVSVVDLAGRGAAAARLRAAPPWASGQVATTPDELHAVLRRLADRADLLQMAAAAEPSSGGTVGQPPVDEARQVLVVHDFPYGFDEESLARLMFLVVVGAATGTDILVVGEQPPPQLPDAAGQPPSTIRLTPVPHPHIEDLWVGLNWTYVPDGAGAGEVVGAVLDRLSRYEA